VQERTLPESPLHSTSIHATKIEVHSALVVAGASVYYIIFVGLIYLCVCGISHVCVRLLACMRVCMPARLHMPFYAFYVRERDTCVQARAGVCASPCMWSRVWTSVCASLRAGMCLFTCLCTFVFWQG